MSQAAGPAQKAAKGQAATCHGCMGPPHWLQGPQAEGSAGCCCSVPAAPAGGLNNCTGQSRQRTHTSHQQGGVAPCASTWPGPCTCGAQCGSRERQTARLGRQNSSPVDILPAGQGLESVAAIARPCASAPSCRAGHLAASAPGLLLLWLAGGGQAPQEGQYAAATECGQAQHQASPLQSSSCPHGSAFSYLRPANTQHCTVQALAENTSGQKQGAESLHEACHNLQLTLEQCAPSASGWPQCSVQI